MSGAKLLEGFNSKLADRWVGAIFTPAFVFWLGGGLAALQNFGWIEVEKFFSHLSEPRLIGLGLLSLMVVAASGFVAQQFEFTVLRLLEGYWPSWCRILSKGLLRRQKHRLGDVDQQLQKFNHKGLASLTLEERQVYVQRDLQLSEFPEPGRLLPTRLGNILRAAEDRCAVKYGLDAVICWPRLWLLLPDAAKTELSATRDALNVTALLWMWSLLFLLWAPIFRVWWPLPLGVVSVWLAYRWMIEAAQVYGALLEAAFDLYRFELYKALHWPLPRNPAQERALGQGLTDYLWHGSEQHFPEFTDCQE
jgi:hypothetical protein